MADNYVSIDIRAANDAKPQLDDLKARLDELGKKVATARADVDDVQADKVLTSLQARLDAVSKKIASPKIDMAGAARALADVTAVDAALDDLGRKDVKPKVDPSGATAFNAAMMLWPAIIAGVGAALPVIPAALTAVGTAAGTAALAFEPVIKALTDWSAASQQTGQTSAQLAQTAQANAVAIASAQQAISDATTQAAHDQITSDQQIASAQQSLADAQRTADQDAITSAESVANAERSLATAQQSEQMAQESLTQARAQAKLTLEQLNNAQADGALQATRAAFNLQDAQLNQQQVDASATSTALQKAEAAQSVAEAQQALLEAQQNATNSTDAANQANQEGVNGLPAVVSAQNAYQTAVQGVANAQQALADASRNAAQQQQKDSEAIANAQQSLANAQQQASWTQAQDAERIQTAINNLNNTYAQQALAAQTAQAAASTASAQFAKDMGLMSGPGQQVVNMLIGMEKELRPLSNMAQGAIMPGVTVFLQGIQSLLPLIVPEIRAMGGLLGDAFGQWGAIMESSSFQGTLKMLFNLGNQFMSVLLPAVTQFVTAFMQMGANSGGAVTGFAQGLSAILGGFDQLFGALSDPKNAQAIGLFWQNLGIIIGELLGPLGQVIGLIAQILVPIMQILAPIIAQVAGAVAQLIQVLPPPVIAAIAGALIGLALAWAAVALAANPVVLAIIAIVIAIAEAVKYWPQISAAAKVAWADVVKWSDEGAHLVANWFDFIRHSVAHIGDDISQAFISGWDTVVNFFEQLPGWLLGQGESAVNGLFSGFVKAWNNQVHFFMDIVNFIGGIFSGLYSWMLAAGENIIIGIWNGLVSGFNQFISGISNLGKSIGNALLGWAGIHFNSPPSAAIYMEAAGRNVARDFTKGITSGAPAAGQALSRLTGNVAGGGGLAGGGQATLLIAPGAGGTGLEAQFWAWLKNGVRNQGGDPSMFQRKVAFALCPHG